MASLLDQQQPGDDLAEQEAARGAVEKSHAGAPAAAMLRGET
jgi:hypothetical protein